MTHLDIQPPQKRNPEELAEIARRMRVSILKMINKAGSGHTGSSLSCVEILAALYFSEMRHVSVQADWPRRDRFILSKGHAAPALYAALHLSGYITQHNLDRLRSINSILQGHPDSKRCPGVEASTGSLGMGLSIAHGMALALRDPEARARPGDREPRIYAVLGDGECQEGQVWEAAMSAAHYHSDNLCAIVDANRLQIDGPVSQVMGVEPLPAKFEAFGWWAQEVDGHDLHAILAALDRARGQAGKPSAIIARTVKGKGVSFCENQVGWHGRAPNDRELAQALAELGEAPDEEAGA